MKYRTICHNLNQLIKINDKESDEMLNYLKMKRENKKLVFFLTNGEFSKLMDKNFDNENIINAQNKYNINSLIIYLKNNYNSKESNCIDNLIVNYDFSKGKNKFIEDLINLKKKKLEQSIINYKFKEISLKLNQIENKLRTIEKDYAAFIKSDIKNKLLTNKFTSVFFDRESQINKYMNINFVEHFGKFGLEKVSFDYEINIISLHPKNENIETRYFKELEKDKSHTIKFYDLDYTYNSKFSSFEKVKNDLIKKRKKKIYIIISLFKLMNDITFLNIVSSNLITNFLSYLFIINTENLSPNTFKFLEFHPKHVQIFEYSENLEKNIKKIIENKYQEIRNNYTKYLLNNVKYTKIIDEYNQTFKYKLIVPKSNFQNEKKIKFEDIIKEHKQFLFEKISQDISFFIALSIENKDEIKNIIEEDLELVINENNKTIINQFLKKQNITDELNKNLKKYIKILIDNNNNIINKDLNEVEQKEKLEENKQKNEKEEGKIYNHLYKYYDEIISINGIPKIYDDEEEDEINDEENSIDDDSGEDLINISNDESNNYFKKKNQEDLDKIDEEDNFKIQLLIEEIKDQLRYLIELINFKLYYKFFSSFISKIFINATTRLLSKKVLDEEQ